MQRRIAPVFDVSTRMLVVDVDDGREVERQERPLAASDPAARAAEVAALGCDAVICCAVSRPMEAALTALGIQVVACTCGPVDEVLDAFINGRLTDRAFLMPGCRGRSRGRGRRRGSGACDRPRSRGRSDLP